jgi:hypothetical protein
VTRCPNFRVPFYLDSPAARSATALITGITASDAPPPVDWVFDNGSTVPPVTRDADRMRERLFLIIEAAGYPDTGDAFLMDHAVGYVIAKLKGPETK